MLSGEEFKRHSQYLQEKFTTKAELAIFLREEMNINLEQVAEGNLANTVFQILIHMESRGQVEDLIQIAVQYKRRIS